MMGPEWSPSIGEVVVLTVLLKVPHLGARVCSFNVTMDQEPSAQHWLIEAAVALRRVTNAKRRVSAAMNVNKVSMLAGTDELEAATKDAMVWVMENPARMSGSTVALPSC